MNRLPVRSTLLVALAMVLIGFSVRTAPALKSHLGEAQQDLAALEGRGSGEQPVSFGVQLQGDQDSPDRYDQRAGRQATLFGDFVEFPFRPQVAAGLSERVEQARKVHASFMLTLEPQDGLGAVSDAALTDLTRQLRKWNQDGTAVIVRFAHEMNGSWYPWGQQPHEYVATFRRVAHAVRLAPASRILWSPNEGGGYPFDGPHNARSGSADFAALDTNGDGKITMADDPYGPYYPGDAYVDWVGLSLYHFGEAYPWGNNVVPEPGKFLAKINGSYANAVLDETTVPNFYAEYADRDGKLFAISETSALFNTGRAPVGPSNVQIKSAWLDQVFAPDIPKHFPRLRLINWFEQDKRENDVRDGVVDWSATRDPQVRAAFLSRIPSWLRFPKTGNPSTPG